jgi:hypothetical protein
MCTQYPAYPKLFALGYDALPFILKRLQSGDHFQVVVPAA